jgi:hypothetical protein
VLKLISVEIETDIDETPSDMPRQRSVQCCGQKMLDVHGSLSADDQNKLTVLADADKPPRRSISECALPTHTVMSETVHGTSLGRGSIKLICA